MLNSEGAFGPGEQVEKKKLTKKTMVNKRAAVNSSAKRKSQPRRYRYGTFCSNQQHVRSTSRGGKT